MQLYSRSNLFQILLRAAGIFVLGSFVGIVYNGLSPHGIALKGNWGKKVSQNSVAVPYSYQEDDPPAVGLDDARTKFQAGATIFVDARYPEDYKSGHIKGAINFPWEEFEEYSPKVLPKLSLDNEIITYCDGTECETSLLLARELRDLGYKKVKTFFGGWSEWQKAGLPVEANKMSPE